MKASSLDETTLGDATKFPSESSPRNTCLECPTMKARLCLAAACLFGLFAAEAAFPADAPSRPAKVLFLTQSKGFVHSSVNRSPSTRKKRGSARRLTLGTTPGQATPGEKPPTSTEKKTLSPAEIAMTQLGQQTGLFQVHCTQDAAADFTREKLKNYAVGVV